MSTKGHCAVKTFMLFVPPPRPAMLFCFRNFHDMFLPKSNHIKNTRMKRAKMLTILSKFTSPRTILRCRSMVRLKNCFDF